MRRSLIIIGVLVAALALSAVLARLGNVARSSEKDHKKNHTSGPAQSEAPAASGVNTEETVPKSLPEISNVYEDIRTVDEWIDAAGKKIGAYPVGTPQNSKFRRTLLAIFRRDPSAINRVFAILSASRLSNFEVQSLVVEAIGESDDPLRAHKMLRAFLINTELSEELKEVVINTMSWPDVAPPETTEMLLRRSRGCGSRLDSLAFEALGRIAFKMRRVDSSAGDGLVKNMIAVYNEHKEARAVAGIEQSLVGLARTRSPEVESILRSHLQDPVPEIRDTVPEAIGVYDPPDRFQLMLNLFSIDAVRSVRLAALDALLPAPDRGSEWQAGQVHKIPVEIRDALMKAMVTDGDDRVREHIVDYWIACYSGEHAEKAPPELKDLFERLALTDPSPNVRSNTAGALKDIRGFIR